MDHERDRQTGLLWQYRAMHCSASAVKTGGKLHRRSKAMRVLKFEHA